MKIAHVVSTYPPYYGGMGNVVFQTASALSARGHEVEVFTAQLGEPPEEEVAFANRLKPSMSYGNAAHLPQLKKELDRFDVVHLHYPFFGTANMVRKWREKQNDRRLVITYHMDARAPSWKGLLFKLYAKHLMPKIIKSADACIASSIDYIERSDAGLLYAAHKEKWTALPFGVDTERFMPREKPQSLFEQYMLNPELPTIIFVGGMDVAHHFKGVPVLLKALARMRNSDRSVQAVLVGDGELREQFEKLSEVYELQSSVRFAGYVTDDELPEYYNMADLCVLPSTAKNEAFGMVLLEAMASGIPVIASDLPGVRSVAEKAGIVVPPKDDKALAEAIYEYVGSETNSDDWKIQARGVAQDEYSWDAIVEQLEQVYTNIRT